jgi:hypothetical protein
MEPVYQKLAVKRLVVLSVQIAKALLNAVKIEFNIADRTVTVLLDEDVGDILPVGVGVVIFLAVQKRYDIGILFNRPRLPKVCQLGDLGAAALD